MKERRSGFDRRGKKNRRAMHDRRDSDNKNWLLPERRSGKDRRNEGVEDESKRRSENERRKSNDGHRIPEMPTIFKIRSVYIKVSDMAAAIDFYSELLNIKPKKAGNVWSEFKLGNMSFGLRLNDSNEELKGSNSVPVFEFYDTEIMDYINRAKDLGAIVLIDALGDEQMKSVVFRDPWGNEFEISKMHDF